MWRLGQWRPMATRGTCMQAGISCWLQEAARCGALASQLAASSGSACISCCSHGQLAWTKKWCQAAPSTCNQGRWYGSNGAVHGPAAARAAGRQLIKSGAAAVLVMLWWPSAAAACGELPATSHSVTTAAPRHMG
mmetsp:Transcript_32054/g.81476  ORF Transcript_32054/g.81476 Transcript_32054/m.81476 type:complete len:135 (-) Transcript_32054:1128-1532(-)